MQLGLAHLLSLDLYRVIHGIAGDLRQQCCTNYLCMPSPECGVYSGLVCVSTDREPLNNVSEKSCSYRISTMDTITGDDDLLSGLSSGLPAILIEANKRLMHKLTAADILAAVQYAGTQAPGTCLLLQPRPLPNSCGTGTIPVAFVVRLSQQIQLRVRRAAQGYGRCHKTPGVWPELKQFPRGDTAAKVARWAEADDCVCISIPAALGVGSRAITCKHEQWNVAT